MKKSRVFIVMMVFFFFTCEKAPDYEKKEELRNLYVLWNLPDEETLKEICILSEKKALSCNGLDTVAYLGIVSSFYKINLPSPQPEDYCNAVISSPVFEEGKFSIDARRCHFDCNRKYWEAQEDCSGTAVLQNYSNCLPVVWVKSCEVTSFKQCLQQCFQQGDPVWFIR